MSTISLPCLKMKFGKKSLHVSEEGSIKLTLSRRGSRVLLTITGKTFPPVVIWVECEIKSYKATSEDFFAEKEYFVLTMVIKFSRPFTKAQKKFWGFGDYLPHVQMGIQFDCQCDAWQNKNYQMFMISLAENFRPSQWETLVSIKESEAAMNAVKLVDTSSTIAIWPERNVPVTLKSWQCLQEREWLNDELVELGIQLAYEKAAPKLAAAKTSVKIMNTFLLAKLLKGGGGPASVESWSGDIFEMNHILIPVNSIDGTHWFLIIVDNPAYLTTRNGHKTSIFVLDSFPTLPRKAEVDAVRGWLSHMAEKAGGKIVKEDIEEVSSAVPRQKNEWDCGIFLIHFARVFLEEPRFYLDLLKTSDLIEEPDNLWGVDELPVIRSDLRKQILGWAVTNCQMFQDGDLVFPPEQVDSEEPEIVA